MDEKVIDVIWIKNKKEILERVHLDTKIRQALWNVIGPMTVPDIWELTTSTRLRININCTFNDVKSLVDDWDYKLYIKENKQIAKIKGHVRV